MQVLLFQLGKESIKKELKKPNGVNALLTKYPYSFSSYTIFDRWNSSVTGLLDGVQQLRLWGNRKSCWGPEMLLLEHAVFSYKRSMHKWQEEGIKPEKDTFDPVALFNLHYC